MSVENVVAFAHSVEQNPKLREQLTAADATADAWVKIGREAGLDFTADELTSAIEARLGRKLDTKDAIRELHAHPSLMAPGELSDEALGHVAGGAPFYPPPIPAPPAPKGPVILITAILIG
ncbi:MAG: Nif11-like leader peptide family natural product precursor [Acetobacteraceae bacterium]|nr:Nif11-like leader peptide family natural product precursor [Acetobacteraceae bacterium]